MLSPPFLPLFRSVALANRRFVHLAPVCPLHHRTTGRHAQFSKLTPKIKKRSQISFCSCRSMDGCSRFLPDVTHIRHQREVTAVSKRPKCRDPLPSLSRTNAPAPSQLSHFRRVALRAMETPFGVSRRVAKKAIVAMAMSISPILTVQFVSKHPLTKVAVMSRCCDCLLGLR